MSGSRRPQVGGYTPAEITAAYGLNAITFTSATGRTIKGNGAGETIALIEEYHDPHIQSDLHAFDKKYGLPNPTLTVVNQAGSRTNNSWALEESMDVEWAHAIAPGAKILVVEAAPANSHTSELESQLNAVNTARKVAGVVAISLLGTDSRGGTANIATGLGSPNGPSLVTDLVASDIGAKPLVTNGSAPVGDALET